MCGVSTYIGGLLLIVYLLPILHYVGVFYSAVGHVPNSIALYFILFSTKYFEHVRPLRLNRKPNHHKCIENVTLVREAGGYK